MQNSKTKKKKADYDVNESVRMVSEPTASYAAIGKAWKKPIMTMDEITPVDDETALANAVSMDTMLEWILEDIHEYYQNLQNETKNNNFTHNNTILP